MKLLHIADLHIGKRVNEFNMLEDQKFTLDAIMQIAERENPDGILIAGDVYDKSQPSAEAVALLDYFLTGLSEAGHTVFLISGNHDSPERLGYGSRLFCKHKLYIAGPFTGSVQKITLHDAFGAVHIYLLPFIKPAMVNPYLDRPVETYDDAVRAVIATTAIHTDERNVLLAHQYVVSDTQKPMRSDSETLSIGGLDQVNVSAFNLFDYVALGHLHGPQKIGKDTVRYAGSPLKYSFSEARHHKSAALIELNGKDCVTVQLIPLPALRDLREIKGPMQELLRIGREDSQGAMDYLHATVTDEEEIYDAIGRLKQVYPNLMALDFENSRTGALTAAYIAAADDTAKKSPTDLFNDFYVLQNNNALTMEQVRFMEQLFIEAGGLEA